jgi:DNA-binding beta-propeller fold protein YncE
VDPWSGEIFATLPLRRGSERLVFDDEIPRELEISPDGRRAFVLYEPGNKLLVLDLEERQLLGVAKTGRGGRKLLRGVAPLLDAATLLPAPVGDFASVAGLAAAVPSFGRERPGNQLLAVRADGRFAYALSASTEDVTVVDTTTAAAVTKIAVGGHRLKALGGAAHIAVIASGRLHILDTAANRTGARLELPGLKDVAVSPDGRHALALADRTVLCLDGVTGSVIATVKGFVQPTAAVFTAAPPAP